jgi:hypothetical protein
MYSKCTLPSRNTPKGLGAARVAGVAESTNIKLRRFIAPKYRGSRLLKAERKGVLLSYITAACTCRRIRLKKVALGERVESGWRAGGERVASGW